MKLIDNLNDMYLRKHVKSLLERFYLMQGINIKDLEKKTNRELIDLLKQYLENQQGKVAELERDNKILVKENAKLKENNKNLELNNDQLYDRNSNLIERLKDDKQNKVLENELVI